MEEATEIRLITLSLKGMQTLEACTENEDSLHSPHRVVCFSQRMLCVLDPQSTHVTKWDFTFLKSMVTIS